MKQRIRANLEVAKQKLAMFLCLAMVMSSFSLVPEELLVAHAAEGESTSITKPGTGVYIENLNELTCTYYYQDGDKINFGPKKWIAIGWEDGSGSARDNYSTEGGHVNDLVLLCDPNDPYNDTQFGNETNAVYANSLVDQKARDLSGEHNVEQNDNTPFTASEISLLKEVTISYPQDYASPGGIYVELKRKVYVPAATYNGDGTYANDTLSLGSEKELSRFQLVT